MLDIHITDEVFRDILRLPQAKRTSVMREIGKMEFQRCADDPFYWLDSERHWIPYVYTKDEHPLWKCRKCPEDEGHSFDKLKLHLHEVHDIDEENALRLQAYFSPIDPIRPFPMKEYFRPLINTWLTEQLILVPKSRDMMATWLYLALYSWDTFFHKGRQNFVQSQTAPKTRDLVKRAFVMYKNQPKFLRDVNKAVFTIGSFNAGVITLDGLDSEMIGLPQGEEQIRQYHPSGIFTDETAFHPKAGETFAAIKPAVQAGGRYTGVSSAFPGWFQLAAEDKLSEDVS